MGGQAGFAQGFYDLPPVEHLVTRSTSALDGQTFDVDNNVWLLGDDDEVLVMDAHDPNAIATTVGIGSPLAVPPAPSARWTRRGGRDLAYQVGVSDDPGDVWD